MIRILRQFLFTLIALAVVGGTTSQLARSAEYATAMIGEMPCDMALTIVGGDQGNPMAPCKGLTPDCIKQMGCVTDVALPARFPVGETTARFATVAYWDVRSISAGVVTQPEPLPPRAG